MPEGKKTLYHSEAAQLGAFHCVVKTEPLKSKYGADKPPYVVLVTDGGAERNYNCENAACEAALRPLKGRSVMLQFTGSRDDAAIKVLGAGSAPAAAPAAAQRQAPDAPEEEPPGFAEPQQARTRTDAPRAPAPTPEQQAKQDAVKAGHYIMQCANLLERNLDAAAWVAARFNAKHANFKKMDTEDVRTMAMSLQIACERNGVQNLMPTAAPKAEGGK